MPGDEGLLLVTRPALATQGLSSLLQHWGSLSPKNSLTVSHTKKTFLKPDGPLLKQVEVMETQRSFRLLALPRASNISTSSRKAESRSSFFSKPLSPLRFVPWPPKTLLLSTCRTWSGEGTRSTTRAPLMHGGGELRLQRGTDQLHCLLSCVISASDFTSQSPKALAFLSTIASSS